MVTLSWLPVRARAVHAPGGATHESLAGSRPDLLHRLGWDRAGPLADSATGRRDALANALKRLAREAMSADLSEFEPWLFDQATSYYTLSLWTGDEDLRRHALTLEHLTGDRRFRPKAEAIYHLWLNEFPERPPRSPARRRCSSNGRRPPPNPARRFTRCDSTRRNSSRPGRHAA